MSVDLSGECLCGAVKIDLTLPDETVDACHCGMCVRWGGGAYLSTRMAEDFTLHGEENVTRYRSSTWAERGFCNQCGTHLFFRYLPADKTSFSPGLFPGAREFTMKEEIFIDGKPGYYSFAGERPRLTGAEVMEKYQPGQ
ncbi:GFA family protein [Sphingomicrobium lutaoense]|uniref:CENP-V/GFA domain-containing protein n=1 Tax=Sphingomicrobium lutaoense TaxID=515949 RepID=A0A839Z7C5_9SPHN|nr:GFA family protein [Sphingomicrobium lutaoense]MBB3764724.1 hypothetical protein [Sphingomicrobium lutaoense]